MRNLRSFIFMVFCSLMSTSAFAAYETKDGVVSSVVVSKPIASGRNVIVKLAGVSTMCNLSSNNDTAYLNRADSPDLFNSFQSLFLFSKAMNKPVRLLIESSGVEGCRIDRVELL